MDYSWKAIGVKTAYGAITIFAVTPYNEASRQEAL
jgi:hypothetical protein